jgi:hypothetical protein
MATGTGKTLTQDASIKLSFPGSSPITNLHVRGGGAASHQKLSQTLCRQRSVPPHD